MPAARFYVGRNGAGLQDGSSVANRKAYSNSAVLARAAAFQTAGRPALVDTDPWFDDAGFRLLTGGTANGQPASATNATVEGRLHRGEQVMRHDKVHMRIGLRIILCGPDTERSFTTDPNSNSPAGSTSAHSGFFGAGTETDPHIIIVMEPDDGLGEPMPDTGGVLETVSTQVSAKGGLKADWDNPANYDTTTGNWTGAVVQKTHSFQVHRPRIGWTFFGQRSKDIRTAAERKTQQLIVNGSNRVMYDPTSTKANPAYTHSDGKTPYWGDQGDIFDMPTKTWRDRGGATGFGLGNYWWQNGASLWAFRGIRWRNFRAPFTNAENRTHKFLHFRDVAVDNATYWNLRGSNASDYYFERVEVVAWSQKAFVMGPNCSRWLFRNVWMDGAFVVGDAIKCGFSAVAPHDAGPLVIEKMYATCLWDAIPLKTIKDSSGNVIGYDLGGYFQGELADYETYNLQVEDFKIDLAGDGCFDTKARTRWLGYRPVVLINGVMSRARRIARLWYPTYAFVDGVPTFDDGAWKMLNSSLILDCVMSDARQYGAYCPTTARHHRVMEWDNNGTGYAMFDINRTFPLTHHWTPVTSERGASSGDDLKGNMTAVLWQPLDARQPGGNSMKHRSSADSWPIPTAAPFRMVIRVSNLAKPDRQLLTAAGAVHDPSFPTTLTGTITLGAPAPGDQWESRNAPAITVAADQQSATITLTAPTAATENDGTV